MKESKKIPWNVIIAKLKENISAKDDMQLSKWLSTSKNQKLFEHIQDLWNAAGEDTSQYTIDSDYYWKILTERMYEKKTGKLIKNKLYTTLRLSIVKYAAVACVILLVSFGIFKYIHSDHTQSVVRHYATTTEKSKIILPDESEVWLHNNSSIIYSFNEKLGIREVTIDGEAFFTINKDNTAFVVHADGVDITVLGTKFNVISSKNRLETSISLLEGSVSLATNNEVKSLAMGQIAIYNKNSERFSLAQGNVNFDILWTSDELYFEDQTLDYICPILEKWYAVEIDLDKNILNNNTSKYTFKVKEESIEEILSIITRVSPIDYQVTKNKIVIMKRK